MEQNFLDRLETASLVTICRFCDMFGHDCKEEIVNQLKKRKSLDDDYRLITDDTQYFLDKHTKATRFLESCTKGISTAQKQPNEASTAEHGVYSLMENMGYRDWLLMALFKKDTHRVMQIKEALKHISASGVQPFTNDQSRWSGTVLSRILSEYEHNLCTDKIFSEITDDLRRFLFKVCSEFDFQNQIFHSKTLEKVVLGADIICRLITQHPQTWLFDRVLTDEGAEIIRYMFDADCNMVYEMAGFRLDNSAWLAYSKLKMNDPVENDALNNSSFKALTREYETLKSVVAQILDANREDHLSGVFELAKHFKHVGNLFFFAAVEEAYNVAAKEGLMKRPVPTAIYELREAVQSGEGSLVKLEQVKDTLEIGDQKGYELLMNKVKTFGNMFPTKRPRGHRSDRP